MVLSPRGPAARSGRLATLLAALLAATAGPAGAGGDDRGLPAFLAPIRADVLARSGRASFRCSEAEGGGPADAFDGKTGTVLRTRGVNPAFLEVSFDAPREVLSAEAYFAGGASHEWSLLAGDDPDRLRTLVDRRRVGPDRWTSVERFGSGVSARIWRLVARRIEGGDSVLIGELSLQSRQVPESIEMQSPSTVVCPAGDLVLRARVNFDGGYRSHSVLGLSIVAPEDAPFRLEPGDAAGGRTVTARYEQTGSAGVRARIRGKGFWLESPPLEIEAREEGLPDWSVGWIERTPRMDFDAPGGGLPGRGEAVVYVAHVRNYGTRSAGRAPYLWQLDGRTVGEGFLEGLDRFEEGTASLRLPWDGQRHELRFAINPSGAIRETSAANNEVVLPTDALRLGIWVERPVLDRFHRLQPSFRDGASGFEDWVQRQLRRWNAMLAASRGPLAPRGVTERVALDLLVVTDEGALPLREGLPANDPDAADRTVDLQRGFPASLLDGDLYARPGERRDDNPLWFDAALLRDLARARSLPDLGRLAVGPGEVELDGIPAAEAVHVSPSARGGDGDAAGGYSPHEASALQRIAGRRARGGNRNPPPDAGEALADLPGTCGIRVVGADGAPLDGVTVRAWRRTRAKDGREVFTGEPIREARTSDGGIADLSPSGDDPFFDGRREGAFDPGQGVLLLELLRGGRSCWRFLEVVPFNLAFWGGERIAHYETVAVDLPR